MATRGTRRSRTLRGGGECPSGPVQMTTSDEAVVRGSGTEMARSRRVSRVFASSPDETRARRALDVVLLTLGVAVVAVAAWADRRGTGPVGRWVADIFDDAPDVVTSVATAMFVAGGLLTVVLVVLVVGRGRWTVIRDTVAAAVVAGVGSAVVSRWVSGAWPDLLPEFGHADRPVYPVVRLALVVAVLMTLGPSLTTPIRTLDRWVVGSTVVSALVLGFGTPTTVVGGLALGVAATAVVRVCFGTAIGIPTTERVAASLADLGVEVTELAYDAVQTGGRRRATAVDDTGRALRVSIYGRDAADSAVAARLWRAMWYRHENWAVGVSREQLAEHEALMLLLASNVGLRVPDVVAVGATGTGDVLLVTTFAGSDRLLAAAGDANGDVTDELLDALWAELRRAHAAGLTLGGIDPRLVVVDGERPGFTDLSQAAATPDRLARRRDIVASLVTSALVAGRARAVAAAARGCDRDDLVDAIGTVQPAALRRELARSAREHELDLDELRSDVAGTVGVEATELVKLHRVRWRDLASLLLALVAANALIGWVSSIDLATFADELADASVGWLLVAFVLSQLTNVAETISMMGVVAQPVPFGPTMQFQYATSYIGLAVPSDAGRIAMTIRYLQKLGVSTRTAVGQGPFTTVLGYVIDLFLLLVTIRVVGTSLELPDDADFSGFTTVLVVVAVLLVGGVVLVLALPSLRRRIVPAVRETVVELRSSLTDPQRAIRLLGGLLAKKLLFAFALASVLAAFGEPLPLATVVFVNTAVSWFAGIFPVPGGIGVAEAGFVVGLTSFGVSESVALAAALSHRLFTTYVPPIAGVFAMRRLEREGYL